MSEEATLDKFAPSSDDDEFQEQATSRFWGDVPEDWRLVDGPDVYDVNPNPKPEEEPNTYIEMDALDTVLPWPKYFGTRNTSEYSGKTFTKGDTLFARITPCTENGKAAIVPEMETEVGIGSTEYAVLSPKREVINPRLLYYLSKSYPVHNYAVSRMRGSTGRQRVPFSVFRRELDIALPPHPEQRKIATVLYTTDQAIKKTEEIIEQEERVLKGTLNELFTRGVDESGSLRPSPDDSPESYEEAGRYSVPTEWNVDSLQNLCTENITYRIVQPGPHVEDGVPYINTEDMTDGDIPTEGLSKTSQEIAEKYSRSEIHTGELVVTIRATIGAVDQVPSELDGANLTRGTARVVPGDSIDNRFLLWAIRSNIIQSELEARVKGTTFDEINLDQLGKIPIPYPTDMKEQTTIVDILSTIDSRIESEKSHLESLHRLKHGLMQDLLSGTVRTTDADIDVPEEIAQYG